MSRARDACDITQLLRRKELPSRDRDAGELKRCLGLSDVIFFGVGKMVGAGILVLIGQAAQFAGPAVFVSYLLTGAAVTCTALCYADFVSRVPLAGGAYSFVYASMGELPAFVTGWLLIFEYSCGAAALARGWTGYLSRLLIECGAQPPKWVHGVDLPGAFELDILAVLLIVFLGAVVTLGVAQSSALNRAITCIKLSCVALVIVVASWHASPAANWGSSPATFAPNGVGGVVSASILVFYSYIGFDAIVSIAEEVREPERNMPLGMLLCIGIAAVIYTLVSVSVTMMTPALGLGTDAPLSTAFRNSGMPIMGIIVAFAAVVGLPSGIMMNLTSQARTLMTLARDGMLPAPLARVSASTQTPVATTCVACVAALLLAAFLPFEVLSMLMSAGTLIALICVNTGFVCRRHVDAGSPLPWATSLAYVVSLVVSCAGFQGAGSRAAQATGGLGAIAAGLCGWSLQSSCPPPPETSRPTFVVPGGALAPLLGTMACTFMLVHSATGRILWPIVIWLAAGVLIYFTYSFSNSKLCPEAAPFVSAQKMH
mmetsp:Transcript_21382/g.63789  ORF Transcript_21382/g.63789 Transcript_21382/m.63789 type:complete len:543 (-) Transcript_21382:35-1663(-)